MIYMMPAKMYWNYINDERHPMTHEQLISYLNWALNIRGTITELHIKEGSN